MTSRRRQAFEYQGPDEGALTLWSENSKLSQKPEVYHARAARFGVAAGWCKDEGTGRCVSSGRMGPSQERKPSLVRSKPLLPLFPLGVARLRLNRSVWGDLMDALLAVPCHSFIGYAVTFNSLGHS